MKNTQALYTRAKQIIPGGTQLLSKRSERFLPDLWPAYYSRAKGCEVWDVDGNHFFDFASMGIGTCSLGYADPDVNAAVVQALHDGSMCTLNCPEEVTLAEQLLDLHPWSDMVRYARTGGEACTMAVRIARAATGRSKVAFCGYHGWHDWYIAANLANKNNLNEQLLQQLTTNGVPSELTGTAIPFLYNDVQSLKNIFSICGEEIACIIFEIQRGVSPDIEFLNEIQRLARKHHSVIICDEVTSGFRVNLGGIHMDLNFKPDIAVFGKTLANGIAMSAVIGKREVMDAAEDSFISSAYWTERLGPAAALATLKKMKSINAQELLINYGLMINKAWETSAVRYHIKIHISGIPPLTHLDFDYPNNNEIQTYYAQLMLDRGYLVGPSVYATTAYNEKLINDFANATDEAFEIISLSLQNEGITPNLRGGVRSDAFRRLVY